MVKLEDVAKKAGLSKSTVSRVLNNDPTLSIADETRERIQSVVDELGYEPLRKRKSQVKKKKYNIAIIHDEEAFTDTVERAYYFSIRNGIEQISLKKNINVTSLPINHLSKKKQDFDGVIILGNISKEKHELIRRKTNTNHFVVVGIFNPYPDYYDHISFNTRNAVYKALDYLRNLGHEKIGCLGAIEFTGILETDSRKSLFIKYMSENNLYNANWVIFGEKGVGAGHEITKRLLELKELPTALFVANDPTAIGVLQALQEHNIQVPQDISVIGFNGDFTTEYTYPPLTTLKVNTRAMGTEAVLSLIEKMKGYRKYSKKVEIATSIIERKSCKILK